MRLWLTRGYLILECYLSFEVFCIYVSIKIKVSWEHWPSLTSIDLLEQNEVPTVQKLVTEVLYWAPVVWSEGWEGAEVDTESIGQQPLAILQVPRPYSWSLKWHLLQLQTDRLTVAFDSGRGVGDSWSCNKQVGMWAWEGPWFSGIAAAPFSSSNSWACLNHPLATLNSSQETPERYRNEYLPSPAPA